MDSLYSREISNPPLLLKEINPPNGLAMSGLKIDLPQPDAPADKFGWTKGMPIARRRKNHSKTINPHGF
jgi:hypothetical protein